MKHISIAKLMIVLMLGVLGLVMTACSSDESEQTTASVQQAAAAPVDHAKHQTDIVIKDEASKSVKEDFIEKFTEVCVEREMKTAVNPDIEEKRAQENCGCIANYIAENLSDADAEKYIDDGVDSRTMQIKFDTATFFCLQNKKQFKGPQIFGKPQ